MKKRDKILLLIILLVAFIITGLIILSSIQLEQFHSVYLQEERQEITALAKQVSWAVKPILRDGNISELEEYCSLFKDSDSRISVSDRDRKLAGESIGSSGEYGRPDIASALDGEEETFIQYNKELKTHILYHSIPLNVDGKFYILSISTATNDISSALIKFEKYIIASVIIGATILLYLAAYFFMRIHIPFNKLQNSAVKIASGDMDTDIFIPNGGILFELSCAIDKMAKRLKKQISDMQKLESFRSEFITNITHEIKTPLTGILSSVEILEEQRENNNPATIKCLNILSKQANRLNSLIQDILSLSHIEMLQIKDDKEFKPFNLSNSILNSVSICSASKGDIEIRTNLEEIEYNGNSYLIEQAVTNLVMNAIRYSKSKTIDISTAKREGSIEIRVKDYGVGIPEEHLGRLFERFYRVDKARSRDLGGTGLGLAIVKNIVELHGGKVSVVSDGGCEFVIGLADK